MENNNILSKDYLIPDVNNKEEYQNYKVRVFTSVPENTVLLCKNKIFLFRCEQASTVQMIHIFLLIKL